MTHAYRTHTRSYDHASQSVVVRSDHRAISAWSVQLLRSRSRYGGREKRGITLFVHAGPVRITVGTR